MWTKCASAFQASSTEMAELHHVYIFSWANPCRGLNKFMNTVKCTTFNLKMSHYFVYVNFSLLPKLLTFLGKASSNS